MSLLLQTPFTMTCVGATSSGKTTFVRDLLANIGQMTVDEPNQILYCYATWQNIYEDMEKNNEKIKFHEGVPDKSVIDYMSNLAPSLIILDDLMEEVTNCKDMQKMFTQYSHHLNISVIFISQNLYYGGKYSKTINLNCHYIILFKNPNLTQIRVLGQQIFPGCHKMLMDAYRDAMRDKYGYLFIDLHPATDNDFMLRTHILPTEDLIIYKPVIEI
jgi:hypothetical protein